MSLCVFRVPKCAIFIFVQLLTVVMGKLNSAKSFFFVCLGVVTSSTENAAIEEICFLVMSWLCTATVLTSLKTLQGVYVDNSTGAKLQLIISITSEDQNHDRNRNCDRYRNKKCNQRH